MEEASEITRDVWVKVLKKTKLWRASEKCLIQCLMSGLKSYRNAKMHLEDNKCPSEEM